MQLSPDRLTFDIVAPTDGTVVVNEAYYRGWRAWVQREGQAPAEVGVRRADGFVREMPVPEGSLRVELRFTPWSGRVYRQMSWAALRIALGLIAFGWRRRRT